MLVTNSQFFAVHSENTLFHLPRQEYDFTSSQHKHLIPIYVIFDHFFTTAMHNSVCISKVTRSPVIWSLQSEYLTLKSDCNVSEYMETAQILLPHVLFLFKWKAEDCNIKSVI